MEISATGWSDYELIDSGGGCRLERFGPYIFSRPCPQAFWQKNPGERKWEEAHAVYHRSSSGGGDWQILRDITDQWVVTRDCQKMIIKPTGFGHLGIFPEQTALWDWIHETVKNAHRSISILNLFAYTGGSTIASALAGASVCHVDGSQGVVTWARQNSELSGLTGHPIRWIVDDAMKFMAREIRRGRTYDGIILDPPSFGRGPKGQVWKLEKNLSELIRMIQTILSKDALFLIFTCHSQHVSAPGLKNLLQPLCHDRKGSLETGELVILPNTGSNELPSGTYARWRSG